MAQTECSKGHLYDPDVYARCPYCNGERVSFVFDRQNEKGKGEFGKTVAARDAAAGGSYATHIGPKISGTKGPDVIKKTTGPADQKGTAGSDQIPKTIPMGWDNNKNSDRKVVGWLVCIDGPEKGKDFHLYAGNNNSVGRSEKMDVAVVKDMTVSEENQARIAYDSKSNIFTFIPGDRCTNINYVNGKACYLPVDIKAYDTIEFGESRFKFVPFCCDCFTWESNAEAGNDT